ncbi:circularly permuted type 2 ATP-grasp protein [Brytella acorum]|uniref:Circularly permuted type 2 ATP-grasp protein n=1 Tax=Brytella acorum TaxID=2959299 RepID=A0AA35Y2U8_9PROT|nr:circularly permuted type 2 ATP-grasp protein [Brytella acorum]MDF3624536.1 circularly permuted type 2 ATP-grasp protein [Brytella acorum]CAI9119615.1 circularly permuted type 2 ATP-grasp protein [Brytella acorum]
MKTDKGSDTVPLFDGYRHGGFFCELTNDHGAKDNDAATVIRDRLAGMTSGVLTERARSAEAELYNLGITFTVYTERTSIDRILPFDLIPRVISNPEWVCLELGLRQRVTALNRFLSDIYQDQEIIRDGVIPADLVLKNPNFCRAMIGFRPASGTYIHICGTDIVRDDSGRFLVLEDNARTPSGVSYVIENRRMMRRCMPDLIADLDVAPVEEYGGNLRRILAEVAPEGISAPQIVLLSPGTYNSAYFEHVFLAREMGVPLVEGRDLRVLNDRVYMRTTAGLQPVHTIYRRIDDAFLDPEAFRPESMLGVPGLMRAYQAGHVTLANAVGTGVADDKAIYAYVPRMIRYYLGEEPVLENVETHICAEPEALAFTLDNIENLVVKPVGESGGYGMIIGPHATAAERDAFRDKLRDDPANYISQPVLRLSTSPTLCGSRVEARHVDLRPFTLTGKSSWVLPGALSRVAIREGSLVVNSSQGGGSKDTWVMAS